MTRAGYVLVGGKSSRMGRDKALMPINGEPLAARVAREVARAAGSAVLVGDPDRYGALGYPVIPDAFPAEGPLGGILTALRHSTAECCLVVACDMPSLSAGFLAGLLSAAENNPGVTIPKGPAGRLEPLCAVWPRSLRAALEAVFAAGARKVTAALADLPVAIYPVAELAPFQNLNTPEDLIGDVAI